MKCPECKGEMRWVGDQSFDEDIFQMVYDCEDCLTELIKTFKIVPHGFSESQYKVAHPQTMFEKWKETGKIDLESGMTKEEIKENGGSIYSDYDEEE